MLCLNGFVNNVRSAQTSNSYIFYPTMRRNRADLGASFTLPLHLCIGIFCTSLHLPSFEMEPAAPLTHVCLGAARRGTKRVASLRVGGFTKVIPTLPEEGYKKKKRERESQEKSRKSKGEKDTHKVPVDRSRHNGRGMECRRTIGSSWRQRSRQWCWW